MERRMNGVDNEYNGELMEWIMNEVDNEWSGE